jgi:4-hydroxy-tetrahydrodipicolinate synthase
MSTLFRGTGVAIVTPFTTGGDIDFAALGKLIQHLIVGEVDYLVVLGTTGETATLTKEEKKKIYSFVAERAAGKITLVAGIGGNNTREVVQNIEQFDYSGYAGVLSVSPYYNKPNQQGIYLHYKAIAECTDKPVILYNVPGRTGMNMTADTTLRLAHEFSNFVAMKEASGNFDQCMEIIRNKPADFLVISGDDAYTLPFISMGMDGVISVIANAYPRLFAGMVNQALAGEIADARSIHYTLLDVMKLIFADGSPGGIKVILEAMGICGPDVRLPLAPVNEQVKAQLLAAMKKI